MISLFLWYLLISVLGLVTLPLATKLFSSFTDKGYSLSRVLGLLLWGYLYWILVSFKVLQNDTAGALFSFTLYSVLVIGLSAAIKEDTEQKNPLNDLVEFYKQNKKTVITIELLFLISLLFWAFVRALNPEVSGTEKPMELAFINSIIRSSSFPPNDPWLSGYSISYYYFGYVLAAMLAVATNTAGSIAFNLMIALVISLSVIGSYGILFNMINRKATSDKLRISLNNYLTPLLAPLFLTVVSNAEGALELFRSMGLGWSNGRSDFWQWLNMKDLNVAPEAIFTWPPRFWFWWRASRVLHDYDFIGNFYEVIDEFPHFSFLLGDLHPHVLSIPFGLLLIAMSLSLLWRDVKADDRTRMPFLVILAVALGGIAFLNTWDLPIYFALVSLVLIVNLVKTNGWKSTAAIELLKTIVPLGVFSILLYIPFYVGFSSQAGGILPNVIFPTRGAYLWIMFLPLLVPVIFGLMRVTKDYRINLVDGGMLTLILVSLLMVFSFLMAWVAQSLPEGAAFMSAQGFATFNQFLSASILRRFEYIGGLITLMVVLTMAVSGLFAYFKTKMSRTTLFFAILTMMGGLLVLAPEFVYLRDQFGTRMNTVFKFYYQAWIFWSIAASYGMIKLVEKSHGVAKAFLVLLLLFSTMVGLVYPVTALPDKTDLKNMATKQYISLDGSLHIKMNNSDEWDAFQWMMAQPSGVVLEAVGGSYTDYARFSTFTGQSTVLGWPGHESQWRGGYDEIGSRQGDIESIYTTREWESARLLLLKYNVDYIVVGNMERNTYPVFEDKFRENLVTAFSSATVTIYQVPTNMR